jgi:hypothetical protein
MSAATFDHKQLARLVWDQLQLDELKASVVALKGIDWNPFDEDADEYVGVFGEINHNFSLIFDVAQKAAAVAQRIVVDGASLSDPQKHKVVVQVLDDLIRLPFYAEPFDGPVIDVLVKSAVKMLRAVNWGIDLPPDVPAVVKFREVG